MLLRSVLLAFIATEVILAKSNGGRNIKLFSNIHTQFEHHKEKWGLEEYRIVNGTYSAIQNHPYMAVLPNCGAVIVGRIWILTAGHCFHEAITYVRVGSSFRIKGQKFKINKMIRHPEYFMTKNGVPYNDVMLLKLEEPLDFNERIQPIEIGSDEDIEAGQSATAIGYGRSSEESPMAVMLARVDVPIMNNKDCEEMYEHRYQLSTSQFCAGFVQGQKDACQGDSGGPLVINNRLIGLTSFGEGCARPKSPGVYARVPAMKSWINYVMKNE